MTVRRLGVATLDSPLTARPDLSRDVVALGLDAGLASVGICGAEAFDGTRNDLQERKRCGLDGGMQFTYRNPERSTDPSRILPGAQSLIVGAWSYRQAEPQPEPSDGTGSTPEATARPVGVVARYARSDHYRSLRVALAVMADHLKKQGWRATLVCDDNGLVDRAAAHRAGLGWFGKNSLILLPGKGSWFVLGSVVTDAPLERSTAAAFGHGEGCGTCSRCLDACPTGALVSPGVLDSRKCLAWLVQAPGTFPVSYRKALGNRIYGCDDCQEVCPINRLSDRKDPPAVASDRHQAHVDLLHLLTASDEDLLVEHGRWYIPGRAPRYLRRNALVALGNGGDGRDPGTAATLSRWLAADDPMLVEHAAWAARELGRDDLISGDGGPSR